jgi:outer membrane protein assembly factor BamB
MMRLVFVGEGSGRFDAFHAPTGELPWQFQAEGGINALSSNEKKQGN